MNEKEQARFDDAVSSLNEFFEVGGDSAWLEGWICGFTDSTNHVEGISNDVIHDNLFDYLDKRKVCYDLSKGKSK